MIDVVHTTVFSAGPGGGVNALEPSFEALWEALRRVRDDGDLRRRRRPPCARQFPVRAGYPEDAATGVAASALGGYLAAHTPPAAPGTVRYEIAQGAAMGRPSRLATVIDWDGSAVTRVRVEGDVEILGRERV